MTAAFHETRWTLVLRARGKGVEAKAALSDLCAASYAPVVAFLQREGAMKMPRGKWRTRFSQGCSRVESARRSASAGGFARRAETFSFQTS